MPHNLEIGYAIKSRYEITDIIHSDDDGAIYLVNDERKIKRAVKEIIPPEAVTKEREENFFKRLETLKQINHTNLIKIDDYFLHNSRYYIVMNMVKGKTLEELIKEKYTDTLPPLKLFMNYMVKACGVLKYLHKMKPEPVIFGYFRPSTILITGSGQIKLFNYGLKNILLKGSPGRTPGFSAPEQCKEGHISTYADIFSLGATTYYILTGKNPEENPRNFQSIREINTSVSQQLENIVFLCLEEAPEKRPLIEDLSAILVKAYIASTIPKPTMPDLKKIKNRIKEEAKKITEQSPSPSEEKRTPGRLARSIMASIKEKEDSPDKHIFEDITLEDGEEPEAKEEISQEEILEEIEYLSSPEAEEEPPPEAEDRPVMKDEVFFELIMGEEEKEEEGTLESIEDILPSKPSLQRAPKTAPLKKPEPPLQRAPKTVPLQKPGPSKTPSAIEEKEEKKEVETEETAVKGDFKKIKDSSAISAFLKSKSRKEKEEKEEVETEEKKKEKKFSSDKIPDLSLLAPYKDLSSPPPMEFYEEIDTVKDNRYEIAEMVAGNYFGALYIVRDYDAEDEEKEIKLLREIQYRDPDNNLNKIKELVKSFEERGALLKKCDHPNLLKVLDHFYEICEEKYTVRLFLVTENPQGLNFKEVLETYKMTEKNMAAMTIFSLIPKICNALSYLHEQKAASIFAGELKPEDLMLCNDGEVKILTYGLAGIFEGVKDEANPLRGTPGLSAPERVLKGTLSPRTDVFSLGTTIYYMLTSKDLAEEPYNIPPVRKLNPYLSNKVGRFVSLCLSLEEASRPTPEQVKRSIELIDFFEIDTSTVKSAEEIEEEKEREKEERKKRRQEKAKEAARLKSSGSILQNKAVLAIIAVIIIAIIGKVIISLLPEKERYPALLYATDKRAVDIIKFKEEETINIALDKPVVAMVYSDKTGYIYGVNSLDESICILTPGRGSVKNKETLDIGPSSITLSKDEDRAYITNTGSNKVSVIDLNKFKNIVNPIKVEPGPVSSVLSHDGKKLAVIHNQKRLTVIDTENNSVYSRANLEYVPLNGAFSKENTKLYIAGSFNGKIPVLDVKTLNETGEIYIEIDAIDIISDDNGEIYAIGEKSETRGEILIIDNDSIKNRYPLDFKPIKMIDGAKENKLYILGQTISGTNYLICEYDKESRNIKIIVQPSSPPIMIVPIYI